MHSARIIEEADTLPFFLVAMPVLSPCLPSAPDGTWSDKRFCCDLRDINSNSVVDRYKMPLPEECFKRMQGATWRSKIDLRTGF
jgi:hypothetical protein